MTAHATLHTEAHLDTITRNLSRGMDRIERRSAYRLTAYDVMWIGGQVSAYRDAARAGLRSAADFRRSSLYHLDQMRQLRREMQPYRTANDLHDLAVQFEKHRCCAVAMRGLSKDRGWRLP